MHAEQHRLLQSAGTFVHSAFLALAMKYQTTVDALVQRALGRELPGAAPDFVTKLDLALLDLWDALFCKARDERTVLGDLRYPRPLPKEATQEQRDELAKAEAAYMEAAVKWWEAMKPELAEAWPPPQNYAAPPTLREIVASHLPPGVELADVRLPTDDDLASMKRIATGDAGGVERGG